MSDDDWVTVEGVRYVPEAPLKAEIARLQDALTREQGGMTPDWKHPMTKDVYQAGLNDGRKSLEPEIAKLRAALEWYADPLIYDDGKGQGARQGGEMSKSSASAWVRLDYEGSADTVKYLTELLLRDEWLLVSDLKIYTEGSLAEWWLLNHAVPTTEGK